MEFSYQGYFDLIHAILDAGYEITGYHDWKEKKNPCIIRHDIDFSLEKALEFAKVEYKQGIKATYFVLLTTDMYNAMSKESEKMIRQFIQMGHDVGFHFDETRYSEMDDMVRGGGIFKKIAFEKEILEQIIGTEVKSVSMHQPSKQFLESDLVIPGMINSYSKEFFINFKYCSDSMRVWHTDIQKDLETRKHARLHILTHPIWWANKEISKEDTLRNLLKDKNDTHLIYIHQYYPNV